MALIFSEYATIVNRLDVMAGWYEVVSGEELSKIRFSLDDAKQIKEIESEVGHDIKTLEYWLRDKVEQPNLLHFGCTSEDVCSLTRSIQVKDAVSVLTSAYDLPEFEIWAKWGGAVGNLNAHYFAGPERDWETDANNFVAQFGIKRLLYTTQVDGHEWLVELLQKLRYAVVSDCLEFEDWRLIQFTALVNVIERGAQVSRLQRDLSNSTVLRNLGTIFALALDIHRNRPVTLHTEDGSDHVPPAPIPSDDPHRDPVATGGEDDPSSLRGPDVR